MKPAEEQKLQRAILALKAGNKPAAMEIFMEALQENPTLDDAWVGLSFCAETIERRKNCLKRALGINPNHAYARSALARIEQAQQRIGQSPNLPLPTGKPSQTRKPWTGNQVFAAFLGIVLIAICLLGGLALAINQQSQDRLVASAGRYRFVEFYADW